MLFVLIQAFDEVAIRFCFLELFQPFETLAGKSIIYLSPSFQTAVDDIFLPSFRFQSELENEAFFSLFNYIATSSCLIP